MSDKGGLDFWLPTRHDLQGGIGPLEHHLLL